MSGIPIAPPNPPKFSYPPRIGLWKCGDPAFHHVLVDTSSAISIQRAIDAFLHWNRFDLIDELAVSVRLSKKPGFDPYESRVGLDPKSKAIPMRGGTREPAPGGEHVLMPAPPDKIRIHLHSQVAFLLSDAGHALTGIVKVEKDVQPEIFLFPLTARDDKGSKRSGAPRDYPATFKTRVGDIEFETPITHGENDEPSHFQLVGYIKKSRAALYSNLEQTNGNFIGFTVHKGLAHTSGTQFPNRYAFTSASSNSKAFIYKSSNTGSFQLSTAQIFVPLEWAVPIRESVDELLEIEAQLGAQGYPFTAEHLTELLGVIEARKFGQAPNQIHANQDFSSTSTSSPSPPVASVPKKFVAPRTAVTPPK